VEWVEWECNPHCSQTKIQKGQFLLPFFFTRKYNSQKCFNKET